MNSEPQPSPQNETPQSTEWDNMPKWHSELSQEQIDELIAEGIDPGDAEYTVSLYNYGIKPTNEQNQNKPEEEPQWDPRLTPEQIDDMAQKGIYEPAGPEYRQALGEFFGFQNIDGNKKPTDGEPSPEGQQKPNGEEKPDNPEDNPDDNKNKVEAEIDIKGIEQEFEEDRKERIEELSGKLDKMLPDLAELYARNRRLIVGSTNRAEFAKVSGEYREMMDECLKLKAKENLEAGKREIADRLEVRLNELKADIEQKLTEFVGGDFENSTKTQEEVDTEKAKLVEEAEKQLRAEYGEMMDALKDKVNADFLEDLIAQETKLEDATTNALDNGTLCRKFVNKVINNKKLKAVLAVAGIAGLAVTGVGLGVGLAAGTMAVGLSFTAGGVAMGAAKGALSGTVMSRQNSEKSAVRGFASEEEIRKGLEGIDVTDTNSDISNVTNYLMDQYSEANQRDRSSNRKKTLISAGIGAVIGGLMSGVHISNVDTSTTTSKQIVGYEPKEIHAANLDKVDIPEGHGAWDTFTQLGGKPENYSKFEDIMFQFDSKYGLVPGSNGEVPGMNGLVGDFAHTYPGHINTWPDAVQTYITEVADEAARQGLIPSVQTGGGPIFNTITQVVTNEVPNAFYNFLARATATVGAGVIGSGISNSNTVRYNRNVNEPAEPTPPTETPPEPTPTPEPEPTPETPETETPTPETPPETPENENPPENPETETPTPEEEQTPSSERLEEIFDFAQRVNEYFGDSIGRNGIVIVSGLSHALLNSGEFNTNAENWWNSLDDETKERVRAFETSIGDDELSNNPLKTWLTSRGEL